VGPFGSNMAKWPFRNRDGGRQRQKHANVPTGGSCDGAIGGDDGARWWGLGIKIVKKRVCQEKGKGKKKGGRKARGLKNAENLWKRREKKLALGGKGWQKTGRGRQKRKKGG